MRAWIHWGVLAFVLVTMGWLIADKERTLRAGTPVLLELAPRDPRSLIQGDYMVLRYSIAGEAQREDLESRGHLVITLDDNAVASFVRVHRGGALGDGELMLTFKNRGGMRIGAESFFFQEGHAERYGGARYGELRVGSGGKAVLVGLRDEHFRRLGPEGS